MHDVLELDDIDDACAQELAAGELASIGQDWEVVMQMLPAQWEAKAAELGAVRRLDRKSTRLNSSHPRLSRMPSSA